MLSLTIKSVRANKARFLLTSVAVLLGVAFMAGTFVLTDTIKQSYDQVTSNVYHSTDAVVRSARETDAADVAGVKTRGTIDASMLNAVRTVPGVKEAQPQQQGVAVIVGHDGALLDTNRNRSTPLALAWQDSPTLNPMTLVAGRAPSAPEDVVIDRASADKGHFVVGETVRVLGPSGTGQFVLAGVAAYGGSDSANGSQVVAFTPDTASQVLGTPGRCSAIQVVAAPGVSQQQLVADLRSAIADPTIEVITGAQATAEAQDAGTTSLRFVDMALVTFAFVALVVGAFVIYNTFSITVAHRARETALLRAIGAKRRQVMRAVRFEALVIGLFASVVGTACGIALAEGLRSLLSSFGLELPSGALVIEPRTIVMSTVVGLVVTSVAAWAPARRAAKVAPIEALRESSLEVSPHSRRRMVLGLVTVVAGVAFSAEGLSGAGASAVSLGALAVFTGVVMVGPAIARRFAQVAGWPLGRLRGAAGSLARENAMRNPRRTAATSSALMIGVALVAFMTVFAASAKASMSTSVDRAMRSDWIVTTQFGMGGLSPSVAERIDALPETGAVASLRLFDVKVADQPTSASAVDPARIEQSVALDVRDGQVADLGVNGVAVQADTANSRHLHIGDTVQLFFPETGDQRFTVDAVYGTKDPLGEYMISTQAYDANVATHVDDYIAVSNGPGFSSEQTRVAIERVLHDFPTAELMTKAEFKGSMAARIDQILNLVYVLLAMALVIALLGIANTLALSVFERSREFGLLRAIGMSKRQVRSTVRWESVLIALLGTALGSVIGLGFSWAVVRALGQQGFNTFTVPVLQLAVLVAGAAVTAIAAATIPARRAARLDVLQAISRNS